MNVELEILRRGRALIEPFGNWTRHSFAREKSKYPVKSESKAACQFCAVGAVQRAKHELGGLTHWPSMWWLNAAARARGFKSAIDFNDSQCPTPQGHAAVLALFDEAIELAEKETIDE